MEHAGRRTSLDRSSLSAGVLAPGFAVTQVTMRVVFILIGRALTTGGPW
jgi:hypothetical protein